MSSEAFSRDKEIGQDRVFQRSASCRSYVVRYTGLVEEFTAFRSEILKAVEEVMERGSFILRDEVSQFEEEIKRLTGSGHCIGVNSGYDALKLALLMLNLRAGDQVLLPSYTFVATAAAVLHAGGTPVFVDVGRDLCIDIDDARRRLTPRCRAIMPVHLNGIPCNMKEVAAFAAENRLEIVEDAAQAIGSRLHGKHVGTFGRFGCFSLHPLKTLSVPGDGGFILTDDGAAAGRLRTLRDHGRENGVHVVAGVNSRLDNLHAAVASVKLRHFEFLAEGRRRVAARYRELLEELAAVLPLKEPDGAYVVWSNYPIICEDADALARSFRAAGVEVFRHLETPVHRLSCFESAQATLPLTEDLCRRVVHLPIHPFLGEKDIEYVSNVIRKHFV